MPRKKGAERPGLRRSAPASSLAQSVVLVNGMAFWDRSQRPIGTANYYLSSSVFDLQSFIIKIQTSQNYTR